LLKFVFGVEEVERRRGTTTVDRSPWATSWVAGVHRRCATYVERFIRATTLAIVLGVAVTLATIHRRMPFLACQSGWLAHRIEALAQCCVLS
jgi:hypothetical protein